jgi:glycosyltransferase involved in cell wall biosynthesis
MTPSDLSRDETAALPTVSIIIPCYNGEQHIGKAIESCLHLDYPAVEIIVVDDGSRDRSLDIIRRYEGVRCIAQANQGQSVARNVGLAASSGEFLVFLDHDDELIPEALGPAIARLNATPEVSFVYGYPLVIDGRGNPISKDTPTNRREENLTYADAFHVRLPIPPSLALFRGDVVRQTGGFATNRRFSEDLDFFLRVLRIAPGRCYDATVVKYRKHANNMSGQKANCLDTTMEILKSQKPYVLGDRALEAEWRAGMKFIARHYGKAIPGEIAKSLRNRDFGRALIAMRIFFRYAPDTVKGVLERLMPSRVVTPRNRTSVAEILQVPPLKLE